MTKINVFTNGCFDLFHFGHLHLLKEAKKLGDILHVGINSDRSISNLKGIERPIIPQEQRAEIVSSIKYVDHVYIFDEPTPIELIKEIMPDIIVKGGDWQTKNIVGKDIVKVIMTIPLINGVSTSRIIENIKEKYNG